MKNLIVAATVGLLASGGVYAGSFATPTTIVSNSTVSGSTCGGAAGQTLPAQGPGVNLGGIIYPHPSYIYSFIADAATASLSVTGADVEFAVTTSETAAPFSPTGYTGGPPVNLTPFNLQNTVRYYILVSIDPSIDATNPPQCRTFSLNVAGRLPVALQNFSVE